MRRLYSFFFYCLIPFLVIRLWWKGRANVAYRSRIGERFGFSNAGTEPITIWLHAVSLGEVIAAVPIVEKLLEKNYAILITTTTPTGEATVKKHFGNRLKHQYLPFDLPSTTRRFFKKINPRLGIIMETELWPNLVNQAHLAKVPLILVNARISPNSLRGYQKIKFLTKPMLNQFSVILAQAKEDRARFIELGADEKRIEQMGSVKFDAVVLEDAKEKYRAVKQKWGAERKVLIAASTHAGEESLLLDILPKLQQIMGPMIFIIVPRHPERFASVYEQTLKAGFKTARFSDPSSLSHDSEVFIVDCIGELTNFYQQSDYAFVGGSFIPQGGHNVLEPIAAGIPVLTGPHMHNFKSITDKLLEAEAMIMVADNQALIEKLQMLNQDDKARLKLIANATAVLEANRGALAFCLKRIESYLV